MKIAILGTRGIPARYGGFETFAEQLSKRLADRGHQVTVYCRRPFTKPDDVEDPRIRRVILPTISSKFVDTVFHTFLSVIHVSFSDAEVVLICNVANSPLAWIPRVFGKPVVFNIDGLDRKRKKWNFLGRFYLLLSEMIAVVTPTRLVTDAYVIQDYYWRRYRKRSTMIAYGAEVPEGCNNLDGFNLSEKQYLLYVSRLEPENNPELVIRAYRKVDTHWPLVVVGGNPYNSLYVKKLKALADPRVVFTGPVYGRAYWRLQNNAGLYLCASEVGGTHPGLVEAMAAGNPVLYLDTPENRETVADCGIAFGRDVDGLSRKIFVTIQDSELRASLGSRARDRAMKDYRWEEITQKYEALFQEVLGHRVAQAVSSSASVSK